MRGSYVGLTVAVLACCLRAVAGATPLAITISNADRKVIITCTCSMRAHRSPSTGVRLRAC